MNGECAPDLLTDTALRVFGIASLLPFQRLAMHNILSACGQFGRLEEDQAPGDQLVILPTGAGKSLCFQLPAVLLEGLSVVVYPLLALMADQMRRLRSSGIEAVMLRGGMSREERRAGFDLLAAGRARLVVTNPETLAAPTVLSALKAAAGRAGVAHLVVDEAHCVSEWGESFRPAYLELGRLRRELAPRVTTAFTATASPAVLGKIRLHLFGGEAVHEIVANADRPNIRYSVLPSLCKDRSLALLLDRLERPSIVFVRSRHGAENLSRYLRRRLGSDEVFFYHAGLDRPEKSAVERWFFSSRDGVLVATCAYGMGVDKADIRTVFHRDVPATVEAYLQESGRGGRDGKAAAAVLLVDPFDRPGAGGADGDPPESRRRFEELLAYARGRSCRRAFLLGLLGQASEYCSGCDLCEGAAADKAEGEAELADFVRRNRRRYDAGESAIVLAGRRNYRAAAGGLDRLADFGRLSGWTREELEAGLAALRAGGRVRVIERGPWKGRLTGG